MEQVRVLLIEDNSKDTLTVQMMLADVKGARYAVTVAKDLAQGRKSLKDARFDIVLLDLTLKDVKGLEALSKLHPEKTSVPVVILTGLDNQKIASDAVRKGAQDFLVKGKLDARLLARTIDYAIERHRAMEAMREKNEELLRLNRLKSEFVSTVSHELRTPLTIVLSSVSNFLDGALGELSEPQKKWIVKIHRHVMQLTDMINDILDLSKLESGKADIKMEEVDASMLAVKVAANLKMLADQKGISISCDLPSGLPSVWASPMRIEQVITNLLTNAIKYTPAGGKVVVSGRAKGPVLRMSVEDTGPGIAVDDQEMIFERFRQVRTRDSGSSTQGIGLGLAICKEIVQRHNGRIWVESPATHHEGASQGSRFCFELPARKIALRSFSEEEAA